MTQKWYLYLVHNYDIYGIMNESVFKHGLTIAQITVKKCCVTDKWKKCT